MNDESVEVEIARRVAWLCIDDACRAVNEALCFVSPDKRIAYSKIAALLCKAEEALSMLAGPFDSLQSNDREPAAGGPSERQMEISGLQEINAATERQKMIADRLQRIVG